jgi:phosphoribosyl-AMP cyclohydrolase / phosphoribosyl-ATP pyrophosphohydrolase
VWIEELKFGDDGLVPVVTQDCDTGAILMLAYADREALRLTSDTGTAHYWSRSRREIWRKGATSGHVQEVVEVRIDCDGDAVLYRVHQTGPACHTGEGSCFFRKVEGGSVRPARELGHILARLERIVAQREVERPEGSYSTYLFDKGVDKILKKLGEETTEVVIAAKNQDASELRYEVADLLFHLLVLLRERGLPLQSVWGELESRFGLPPRAAAEVGAVGSG